jgi:hypothetical protein
VGSCGRGRLPACAGGGSGENRCTGTSPVRGSADSDVAESRGDRAGFESELRKHKGTYSFYQTLLEKDKAEIYKAYREGASFAKIRKMIISRKLHR